MINQISLYVVQAIIVLVIAKASKYFGEKFSEARFTCRIVATYRKDPIQKIDQCRSKIDELQDDRLRMILHKYLDRAVIANYSIDIPMVLSTGLNRGRELPFDEVLRNIELIVDDIEYGDCDINDINISEDEMIAGFDRSFKNIVETWEKNIKELEKLEG